MPQTVIENTVSARDLNEMAVHFNNDPWGSYRDNIHIGILASLVANAFRGKGQKALTFQDFMLIDRDEHRKKKSQEFLGYLDKIAKPKKKK